MAHGLSQAIGMEQCHPTVGTEGEKAEIYVDSTSVRRTQAVGEAGHGNKSGPPLLAYDIICYIQKY